MPSQRFRMTVLIVWVTGFLIGTTTHAIDLMSEGSQTYADFPAAVRLFWISLTILDPLTAAFLVLRRRIGIITALAVMTVDVTVNWTVLATSGGISLFGVVCQSLFAAVLFGSAKTLWRWFGRTPATQTQSPVI